MPSCGIEPGLPTPYGKPCICNIAKSLICESAPATKSSLIVEPVKSALPNEDKTGIL